MNPDKKTTPMKPCVTILTPGKPPVVLSMKEAFGLGILSNEAFPHFKFKKDTPDVVGVADVRYLFGRPYGWVKCAHCNKTHCDHICLDCGRANYSAMCYADDIENHAKLCGSFWCVFDAHKKRKRQVNEIKCPSVIRTHICQCCYKVEAPALFKCEKCQSVQYCSKECQEKDWKEVHQSLCAAYQKEEEEEEEDVDCMHAQCKGSGVCLLHE